MVRGEEGCMLLCGLNQIERESGGGGGGELRTGI